MARIVGAIAASHTPTIGFAFDHDKARDPVWAPIFDAYRPIQQWLAVKRPDVLLFIYNDHVTSFFFDQSLEDFQKTRNAPRALYSVAGGSGPTLEWDRLHAEGST